MAKKIKVKTNPKVTKNGNPIIPDTAGGDSPLKPKK